MAGFFQPAPIYGVGTPNARFFSPGNPIFGTPDGYSSNIFSAPILNNSGQYMFQGGSSNSNIVSRGVAFGQNRDGYNGNTQSPAPQGAAYADFAPGTSINGTDLKFANVSSNSKKLFNNAGNWAFHAQLNANPAGASLPVYINTTTNAAPTSDINSGGFYVNTGGVSQLALRSSDRLLDLDATGNTKLGNKVVELHVSRGQSVEPSHTAFKVADLRTLWIELAVFERDLGHVRRDDGVELSAQSNLGTVLRGKVAHVGDVIDLETRRVLNNIRVILEGSGASMKDVVKCLVFLKDGRDFAAMNEVYAEFFGEAKPARSTVEVRFANERMKVEIEAVAYRPKA